MQGTGGLAKMKTSKKLAKVESVIKKLINKKRPQKDNYISKTPNLQARQDRDAKLLKYGFITDSTMGGQPNRRKTTMIKKAKADGILLNMGEHTMPHPFGDKDITLPELAKKKKSVNFRFMDQA